MTRPTSLRQRLSFFLFLPVALLLIGMGVAGFVYARNSLLAQWKEASILKLQRAAHNVDMRLSHVKEWIRVFNETAGEEYSDLINIWVVAQLKKLRGVARVNLVWENERPDQVTPSDSFPKMRNMGRRHQMPTSGGKMFMRHFHGARIKQITPPRYDELAENETVSLISELNDESGQTIGRLEVLLNFDYLIENVVASG
jgi:adenylate cyclase